MTKNIQNDEKYHSIFDRNYYCSALQALPGFVNDNNVKEKKSEYPHNVKLSLNICQRIMTAPFLFLWKWTLNGINLKFTISTSIPRLICAKKFPTHFRILPKPTKWFR